MIEEYVKIDDPRLTDTRNPKHHVHPISQVLDLQLHLNGKQPVLIDGVNIKTINGQSILGEGDLALSVPSGGEGVSGIIVSSTPPENPLLNQLWIDIS